MTWENYRRCAERGKVLSDGALVWHCTRRATDLDRRFVRDGHLRNQDVMSVQAFRGGHARVLHLDEEADQGAVNGYMPVEVGYAQARCPSPERNMISAIDLGTWLEGLTEGR